MSLPSSEQLETLLRDLYIQLLWKQRTHTHMSDLDYPRRSLYDRLHPQEPSIASILNFVRGESSHSFFRDVLGQLPGVAVEKLGTTKTESGHPLISHPDVTFLKGGAWPDGVVWEFKSTIRNRPRKVWVTRLHRYMAIDDVRVGVLAVHYLMRNIIRCYPLQLSSNRLKEIREGVLYFADLFVKGNEEERNFFPQCDNCHFVGSRCIHRHRCAKDGIQVPGVV